MPKPDIYDLLSKGLSRNKYMVMHFTQVDGESWKANYFGVGVGIGVGIEKVVFDPDSDSDPDPDPIYLSEGPIKK
jgi:hypothetical protein